MACPCHSLKDPTSWSRYGMAFPPFPGRLSVVMRCGSLSVATRDARSGQGNPGKASPLLAEPSWRTPMDTAISSEPAISADRRSLLLWGIMMAGAMGLGASSAQAQQTGRSGQREVDGLRKGMLSFMLAHEQFPVSDLVQLGALASKSGFQVL